MIQILWSPDNGKCSQCSCESSHIRMFTSDSSMTYLCKDCWFLFVLECDIPLGQWENEVSEDWDIDTDMILTCNDPKRIEITDTVIEMINKNRVAASA